MPDPWITGPIPQPWFDGLVALKGASIVTKLLDAVSVASATGGDGYVLERTVERWVSQVREADFDGDGDGTGNLPVHIVLPPWWRRWRPPVPRPNEILVDPALILTVAAVTVLEADVDSDLPSNDEAVARLLDTAQHVVREHSR